MLVTHSVAWKRPCAEFEEGSKDHKTWSEFLRMWPDLAVEIATINSNRWNGKNPWDDEHRVMYMEDEIPLAEQWDKHILSCRNIQEIKKAAAGGCVRSVIELDHLQRNDRNKR